MGGMRCMWLPFVDKMGMTPLMYAASQGSLDVARLLIKNKAQADLKTKYGWCLLHVTAMHDQVH